MQAGVDDQERSPQQMTRGEQKQRGRFVKGFLLGSGVAIIAACIGFGVWFSLIDWLAGLDSLFMVILIFVFPPLAGGMVSGWVMASSLRGHRCRFLYLALGSPAVPALCVVIPAMGAGVAFSHDFYPLAVAASTGVAVSAVVGAFVGSRLAAVT